VQPWEYSYQYIIDGDDVLVAPICLRCLGCSFVSYGGTAMLDHQVKEGHFYMMTVETDKIAKWKPNIHPGIPKVIQKHLPEKFKQRMMKDGSSLLQEDNSHE
jgi:hypothetical protein